MKLAGPAEGYFTQATSLGLLPAGASDAEKLAFWHSERDKCWAMF